MLFEALVGVYAARGISASAAEDASRRGSERGAKDQASGRAHTRAARRCRRRGQILAQRSRRGYNRRRVPTRKSLAIRVLGPYGGSAPGFRMTTFLVDGETALDAGSLTEALPLSAQRRIRRIVLTHAHFDHTASLPFLIENLYGRGMPLEIAAPARC